MKAEFESMPLQKSEETKKYQLEIDDKIVFIDYKETETQVSLLHTEADPALTGTGAAAALVEKTLHEIETINKKVLPFCPYVFNFIKKHPEWKTLVDPKFKGFDNI